MIFALVAALLVPRFLAAEAWRRDPLVQDMSTIPKIAWTAKSGQRCYATPDDDHAIFSDTMSVWSLDLRDGSTRWKVDLERTWGTPMCLPESDVVSISEYGRADTVVRTTLLTASTGAHLADLPGDEVTQVIPVGPYIGLLGRSNLLTAVTLDDLDTPLWSHHLSGPSDGLGPIYAMPPDESTTQLFYTKSDHDGTGDSTATSCPPRTGPHPVVCGNLNGRTALRACGGRHHQPQLRR